MITCGLCSARAVHIVDHISRRTRKVQRSWPVCAEHAQAEIELAASGLSMVDIDLRPVNP